MTTEEKKKLYAALSLPFPDEAVERSQGRLTGRGYDTTGIKYQYVVNRLNEILGIGGYRTQQKIDIKTSVTQKGRTQYEATCEVTLQLGEWKAGQFDPFAESFGVGGHTSTSEADARKGAFTNGFKKCAAMICGCGKQAYEGTIDDDNVPADEPSGYTPPRNDPRPEPPPAGAQTQTPQTPPQTRPAPASNAATTRSQPPAASAQNNNASRNRLTSKQLAAIWALARKLNYDQRTLREQIKKRFNCQPEFLDKDAASTIIGELSARASNGASHPAGEHGAAA